MSTPYTPLRTMTNNSPTLRTQTNKPIGIETALYCRTLSSVRIIRALLPIHLNSVKHLPSLRLCTIFQHIFFPSETLSCCRSSIC
ncbi:hypothetical protein VTN77DRAFT_1262 [Rasamsonia byssochlamydoides]|uniref:uncharacterized protein n=1 Tax=Rasamsonia byssochlamydoides TaxID=89139 RepID=UPI0037442611